MKTILSLLLVCIALSACDPTPVSSVISEDTGAHEIKIPDYLVPIRYHVVVIDGQEYFATQGHGGSWSLCPKIK